MGPPKYVANGMIKSKDMAKDQMADAVTRIRNRKYGFSTYIRKLAASSVGSPAIGVASEPRGTKGAPQGSDKEAPEAKRGRASVEVSLS